MVTAGQVAERFQLGRAVGYARLGGLVRLGLLEHARIFHASPGVYLATRAGLACVDLALPPSRVDLRTYDHDLELSALVIELEREFGVGRVKTERELRSADTFNGAEPKFALPMADARGRLQLTPVGRRRLHFPDAAIRLEGDRVLSVELERTAKGRARLRRILAAYISAQNVVRVRYYVCSDQVGDLVASEVADLRAQPLVEIRAWRAHAPVRVHRGAA